MPQIPNYEHIKGKTFLVWTQAGFRKAMKLSNEENETYQGRYPERYPAVVTFLMATIPTISLVALSTLRIWREFCR